MYRFLACLEWRRTLHSFLTAFSRENLSMFVSRVWLNEAAALRTGIQGHGKLPFCWRSGLCQWSSNVANLQDLHSKIGFSVGCPQVMGTWRERIPNWQKIRQEFRRMHPLYWKLWLDFSFSLLGSEAPWHSERNENAIWMQSECITCWSVHGSLLFVFVSEVILCCICFLSDRTCGRVPTVLRRCGKNWVLSTANFGIRRDLEHQREFNCGMIGTWKLWKLKRL